MSKCSFVAIDFETATTNRFPCQMGFVVVRDGKIVERKEYLIKPPENKYSPNCIKIHHIKPHITENCKEFPELWDEIKEYLRCETIVSHNINFDIDVLSRVLEYYKLEFVPFLAIACTCELFNHRSLSDVAEAIGFEIINKHSALADAEACARIFLAYLIEGVDPNKLNYPERINSNQKRNDYFKDQNNVLSKEVIRQDLNIVENKDNYFYDKKIVISGTFERFPIREELAQLLKNYGADINTSISKITNIIIAGDNAGPKKKELFEKFKNEGCNIEVIKCHQLYEILENINNNHSNN